MSLVICRDAPTTKSRWQEQRNSRTSSARGSSLALYSRVERALRTPGRSRSGRSNHPPVEIVLEYHLRAWDDAAVDEQYPCWTVAKDASSDSAIVFSEHGHGQHSPWGLVSMSQLWFGMDSGWFRRLEDAFVDSAMSSDLPIWNVVAPDGTIVQSSLRFDEAFELRGRLDLTERRPVHHVVYRNLPAAGVP